MAIATSHKVSSDEEEKAWVWKTESGDVWFDDGTKVHARIEIERWEDLSPSGPIDEQVTAEQTSRRVPYYLEVSVLHIGINIELTDFRLRWELLGLVGWTGGKLNQMETPI